MASTAQICWPYAGVEKERRCGVALSGLNIGATANARTTRKTLWRAFLKFGADLLRAVDPMERCRIGSSRLRERSVTCFVFQWAAMPIVVWRNRLEHWQCVITRNLARAIVCLAGRRLAISPVPDPGPWP